VNTTPIVEKPASFSGPRPPSNARFRLSGAARQTSYLFICQLLGILLGFGINLINTRSLGPADYGLFAATFAATEFVTLFMDFGFFSSGARVLALRRDAPEEQRRLVGALIVIALALSCLGAALLFGLSFFVRPLLNAPIERFLRWFCLLLGLLTGQTLVEVTCRGMGRIEALSFFNLSSKVFGLLLLGIVMAAGIYSLPVALAASLLGSLAACVHILYRFRPQFQNLTEAIKALWSDLKVYGFHAYTGDLACTASSRTDSLIVSHFVNATAVGYYRLAVLVMTPMITFSRSLSTTMFSRFADRPRISGRVLMANAGWLAFCVLGVIALGKPAIHFIFGPKYDAVSALLPLVALACLFNGLAQPLNKFLGAQGQGRYLRTIALAVAAGSLLLNFGLIPKYGLMGACFAGAGITLINLILHFYYYRLTVRARS